jgi:DNA-binding transcriptional ArsR family regulator
MRRRGEKLRLNEVFAKVGKGLAHANRLELLEVLAQGPRDVDSLASCCRMSVANTSHHLKQLRECGLIVCDRQGQRMVYSLADDSVVTLISTLHGIAVRNLPEMDRLLASRFPDQPADEIGPEELAGYLGRKDVKIFDLRPPEEYATGHVPGALSADSESLDLLDDAAEDELCIVYCRGPFCMSPTVAEGILRSKGYTVKRLAGGYPAWRVDGREIETA